MRNHLLVILVVLYPTYALPWLRKAAVDRSWLKTESDEGSSSSPRFEVNPNFGFRTYHQVRYEPMTVPFALEFSGDLPPLEFSMPNSASAQDLQFLEGTARSAKKHSRSSSSLSSLFPFSGFMMNLMSLFGYDDQSKNFMPPPRTSLSGEFGSRQTPYGY